MTFIPEFEKRLLHTDRHVTYFILDAASRAVKIGATRKDPSVRLAGFRPGNPNPIELVAVRSGGRHELDYHARWSEWRMEGEWFSLDAPGLIDEIQAFRLRDAHPELEAVPA